MSTQHIGAAGELLVQYRLLKLGIDSARLTAGSPRVVRSDSFHPHAAPFVGHCCWQGLRRGDRTEALQSPVAINNSPRVPRP